MPQLRNPSGKPQVWTLMGPTASGKTQAALDVAAQGGITLVSVDSAMVYRGLDIGTAKPSTEIQSRIPHALIDIRDPDGTYSASEFVEDADREVRRAFSRGELPLLIGGSMLYFRTFRDGLSALPSADQDFREALRARRQELGLAALFAELKAIDPEVAARMDPRNYVRIERALEVHALSGTPISEWWKRDPGTPAEVRLNCELVQFAITQMDRSALHRSIEERLDRMLQSGFLAEVLSLKDRYELSDASPSMRSVGYQQIWNHLKSGSGDLKRLREQILSATRRAAKRQLSWMRHWPGLDRGRRLEPQAASEVLVSAYGRALQ